MSTVRTLNGSWLLRGRDGSLSTYASRNEAVWCRAEHRPGLPWTPPRKVGAELITGRTGSANGWAASASVNS
ncbi:hypothetical protein ACWDAZ_22340, partial [Streptomyces sp. NPDC001215]